MMRRRDLAIGNGTLRPGRDRFRENIEAHGARGEIQLQLALNPQPQIRIRAGLREVPRIFALRLQQALLQRTQSPL